mmetsp:Transcript_25488/g.67376  ORF Transcript_25488/g.67376 Transcript_25488/m.67376 type:complete len:270 (+) Transcript_25488:48-857(+)
MANAGCHYTVLGLRRDASEDGIRQGYKRAAMRWHPDKNPEDTEQAHAMFKRVAEAYSVLSDPQKRAVYDGASAAACAAPPFVDPYAVFNQFFAGNGFGDMFGGMFGNMMGMAMGPMGMPPAGMPYGCAGGPGGGCAGGCGPQWSSWSSSPPPQGNSWSPGPGQQQQWSSWGAGPGQQQQQQQWSSGGSGPVQQWSSWSSGPQGPQQQGCWSSSWSSGTGSDGFVSTSTSSQMRNGRRVCVTERTVQRPDGTTETQRTESEIPGGGGRSP